jgi:hypothetical protein
MLYKTFCVLFLSLLATASLAAQQMISGTLQVNGVDRIYLLHLPAGDRSKGHWAEHLG